MYLWCVCVWACVCIGVWGRCHHTPTAAAEVSSMGKMYRSLPAPTGKIFSQCAERCHFLITSLEYQRLARCSGTNCGVPSCDMIKKKKRLLRELPGRRPPGRRAWSCRVTWARRRPTGEGAETEVCHVAEHMHRPLAVWNAFTFHALGVSFYSFSSNYPSGHQKGGGARQELRDPASSFPRSERCHCNSNREASPSTGRQGLCLLVLLPGGNGSIWHPGG